MQLLTRACLFCADEVAASDQWQDAAAAPASNDAGATAADDADMEWEEA
jgi:hypothetical protein